MTKQEENKKKQTTLQNLRKLLDEAYSKEQLIRESYFQAVRNSLSPSTNYGKTIKLLSVTESYESSKNKIKALKRRIKKLNKPISGVDQSVLTNKTKLPPYSMPGGIMATPSYEAVHAISNGGPAIPGSPWDTVSPWGNALMQKKPAVPAPQELHYIATSPVESLLRESMHAQSAKKVTYKIIKKASPRAALNSPNNLPPEEDFFTEDEVYEVDIG